jgi:hypothetical protein
VVPFNCGGLTRFFCSQVTAVIGQVSQDFSCP